ncbi:MAG TPA: LacI family DNA-binding transcriptional regulator [Candidatus Hydrogenedentes bacterium]|nr:LacI family DNA-binding transcriptional regulator [Candidatus Hydrogenedentota bacterium]
MVDRPVTLKDVAVRARVSTSTVSRVLNKKLLSIPVTAETRARIFAAARELGYRPNRFARGLITAKTNIIGVYEPLFALLDGVGNSIPMWLRMGFAAVGAQLAGIQSVAHSKQYDLHIFHDFVPPADDGADGLACPDLLDGMIFPAPSLQDFKLVKQWGLLTVGIHYDPPEFNRDFDVSGVYLDSLAEVYRVIRGWTHGGHTRIALIPFHDEPPFAPRYELAAYKRALAEADIPFDEQLVVSRPGEEGHGILLAKRLLGLAQPPTAIFVGKSDKAVDVLRGVRECGKRCPEDVEIVVWCNDHAFEATEPPLAALEISFHKIGAEAVRLLCDEIEGGHTFSLRVIPCEFMPRPSCTLPAL